MDLGLDVEDNYKDELTNIPNMKYLFKYYEGIKKNNIGAIYFDIDNFNCINNSYGKDLGNELLIRFSEKLKKEIKNQGKIFKLNEDEFLVVFPNNEKKELKVLAKNLMDKVSAVYKIHGKEISITTSGGLYTSKKEEDIEEVLRKLDIAMHASKNTGKYRLTVFDESLENVVKRKTEILIRLKKALLNEEFYLHFQPIYDLSTNKIYGVEALARWKNDDLGEVSPGEFIPLLEQSGLIVKFGLYILKKVFEQMEKWENEGIKLKINVNISSLQLSDENFVSSIIELKNRFNVDLKRIVFELTETHTMNIDEKQNDMLKRLIDLGITFALDDYGNAYSQITNLVKLPAKEIKLAKELIDNIDEDYRVRMMIKNFIELFTSLGYEVIVEGVEKRSQFDYLKEIGCNKIQGYYLKKPMEAIHISKLFEN